MQKAIKYTIFKTKWGYFGLVGTEFGLLRTCLPGPEPEKIKSQLLKNLHTPQYDKSLFKTTQEQITAYFESTCVNFDRDVPIAWDYYTSICHWRASGNPQTIADRKSTQVLPVQKVTEFTKQVLTACRNVGFGRTISYSGLAKKLGRPAASRAVGSALAKNPLPLIIPCHRVIRSDGKIGGFSAVGGKDLKAKLLKHEQAALIHYESLCSKVPVNQSYSRCTTLLR